MVIFKMIGIILINTNKIVMIDNEDYKKISKYKWYDDGRGYAITNIKKNNKSIPINMHRLIMNFPKNMEIDHKNRNKLDNTKNNLRIVTNHQNKMNYPPLKNCKSKYKGVSKQKNRKKWRASITFENEYIHIGMFISEIEAAKAYNIKAKELFGKYVYLNEV